MICDSGGPEVVIMRDLVVLYGSVSARKSEVFNKDTIYQHSHKSPS